MLDGEKRISIPAELRELSNLKEVKKVILTTRGEDILFIPYSEENLEEVKAYGIRAVDSKGRVMLPPLFVRMSSEWEVYLLNGEILATRHIF